MVSELSRITETKYPQHYVQINASRSDFFYSTYHLTILSGIYSITETTSSKITLHSFKLVNKIKRAAARVSQSERFEEALSQWGEFKAALSVSSTNGRRRMFGETFLAMVIIVVVPFGATSEGCKTHTHTHTHARMSTHTHINTINDVFLSQRWSYLGCFLKVHYTESNHLVELGNDMTSHTLLKWHFHISFISFIYLFSHLADAFIQSDLQMRTLWKQSKPTKEQQHASAVTSPD